MAGWENKIVGHGAEPPDQLLANPNNWRIHPKAQQEALADAIAEVGYIRSVTVNRRTGHVIDGHLRVALALRQGVKSIPVEYVELSEEEEAEALATLDPIAAMAGADREKLGALLQEVQTGSAAIGEMLSGLAIPEGGAEGGDDDIGSFDAVSDEAAGAYQLRPAMFFPSDSPYGLPQLLPDRCAPLPEPIRVWSGTDMADPSWQGYWLLCYGADGIRGLPLERTVVSFYTDDARFEKFWVSPDKYTQKLLNAGVAAVIMPNFTIGRAFPFVVNLWQQYRSLWCARYFQEAGLPVIPDVNWTGGESYSLLGLGIPEGAPCVSVQLQSRPRDKYAEEYIKGGLHDIVHKLKPETILLYGGKFGFDLADAVIPPNQRQIRLRTRQDMRRDKIKNALGGLK